MKGHTITITNPGLGDYLIPTHLPSVSDQLYIGPMGGFMIQYDRMEHLGWTWYEPGCMPEHPVDHFFYDGKIVILNDHDTIPEEPIHWYAPGEQFFDRHESDYLRSATGCFQLASGKRWAEYRVFCYQVGYSMKEPSDGNDNYCSISYMDYRLNLSPTSLDSSRSVMRIDACMCSEVKFMQCLRTFSHIPPSALRKLDRLSFSYAENSWLHKEINPFNSSDSIGALESLGVVSLLNNVLLRFYLSDVEDGVRNLFNKKKRDDAIFDSLEAMSVTSINSVETVNDLQEISSLIPKIGPVKNAKLAIKAIAGLYLWYKYVFSTSLSDSKEFLHILRTLPPRKVLERKLLKDDLLGQGKSTDTVNLPMINSDVRFSYGSKVRYSFLSTGFLALLERMTVLGLFPSLSDFYAVVPYSFIVDWAVPIGSFIERKQLVDTLSNHRLKHLTASVNAKFRLDRELGSFVVSTGGTFKNYKAIARLNGSWFKRVVSDDLDVEITLMFKDPSKHKIEGAALLVSQFVKD